MFMVCLEKQWMEILTLTFLKGAVHILRKTTPVGGEWTWVQTMLMSLKFI